MKNKFTDRQQLAWSLYRERKKIWEAQRKLGRHKLKHPIQKGWQKEFRVRDDIMRSSEGARFKEILPHIQDYVVSRTTEFVDYLGEPIEPKLNKISINQMEEIGWEGWFVKKYFAHLIDWHSGYRTGVEFKYKYAYFIKRDSAFEKIIVPHYITHLPIISPELNSREKEISNKIEKHHLAPLIDKIVGGRGYGCGCEYCLGVKRKREIIKIFEQEVRESLSN